MHLLKKVHNLSLVLGLFFLPALSLAEPNNSLTTSFGAKMLSEAPETSLSLEPKGKVIASSNAEVNFYAFVDRPTNGGDVAIPNIDIALDLFKTDDDLTWGLWTQVSAIDLPDWVNAGSRNRLSLVPYISYQAQTWLKLEVTAGPFGQVSEQARDTDGVRFPEWGFWEELKATLTYQKWELKLSLYGLQGHSDEWNDEYLALQQIQYQITPTLGLGINHQVLGWATDEHTGHRKFVLASATHSRFTGFLQMKF